MLCTALYEVIIRAFGAVFTFCRPPQAGNSPRSSAGVLHENEKVVVKKVLVKGIHLPISCLPFFDLSSKSSPTARTTCAIPVKSPIRIQNSP